MIVESKAKNETELAQYARTKSVYIEQLRQGRVICEKANGNHSFERDHLNTGETKSAGYYYIHIHIYSSPGKSRLICIQFEVDILPSLSPPLREWSPLKHGIATELHRLTQHFSSPKYFSSR